MKSVIVALMFKGKKTSVSVDRILWKLFMANNKDDYSKCTAKVREYCQSAGVVKSEYVRQWILLQVAKPSLVRKSVGLEFQPDMFEE